MPNFNAYLDDFGLIRVWMNRNFYGGRSDSFYITGEDGYISELIITGIEEHESSIRYNLTGPAGLEFGRRYMIREQHGQSVSLEHRMIVNTKQFNDRFMYRGNDLGATYSPTHTDFAVWAPTAVSVILKLHSGKTVKPYLMKRSERGVYRARIYGDLKRTTYTYLVERNGIIVETCDPYALSSTANGRESAVIDEGEIRKIRDWPLKDKITGTDAVIYETNVRDLTASPLTGTSSHSTFSAFVEEGTKHKEIPTGLDHIVSLGVTHVQLMPVMDFATVDENHPEKGYNWGYDPAHYLVPEGSYSSNPDNPYSRVKELRKLICALHRHQLRVTLDVVFNHVYDIDTSPFQRTVPYYFFRYNASGYLSNGSYCGNDFASEKPMANKYILDTITKIMDLYGADGFRFDLMGILDVGTMNAIRDAARKIKPEAMIYGEGWDMPTVIDGSLKATIMNQGKMPFIGHFNDYFRDIVKGKTSDDQKYEKGYVTGDLGMSFGVLSALSANVLADPYFKRFTTPDQSINALETHDNSTLWDKMRACCSNEDRGTRQQRQKMLIATEMVAQGVPFIHAGMEFCATKNDNSNSYNAGDVINQMDWERAYINREIIEFTRKAIALRKKYPAFRLKRTEDVQKYVRLSVAEGGIVFYDINYIDNENHVNIVRVIINPTYDDRYYTFEPGWHIVFNRNGDSEEGERSDIQVPRLSVIVCTR
ncbi:MAG: type I pullulanase [Erysipelotrichaceae bacterium]|nr:type I pullulanase [Erysipelotrichaceae bacterium]